MQQVNMEGSIRAERGKERAKKLRNTGVIPAVLYGRGIEPLSIQVKAADLSKALRTDAGQNVIINLKLSGDGAKTDAYSVMIADFQTDVFQKGYLHVDFRKISLTDRVTAKVRVELTGNAVGAKEGGVLDHLLWEVEVESLPLSIPESIEVDISELNIGDSIHVKDLKTPEGVAILDDPEEMVAVCHPPRVEAAPEVVAAAPTTAEPEVIAKGKEEKEEKEKE